MRRRRALTLIGSLALPLLSSGGLAVRSSLAGPVPKLADLSKIQHVIVIMQENRSFDQYFGVYHGTSGQTVYGFPHRPNGSIAVCIPDPALGHCARPYHNANPILRMQGGPHSWGAAQTDIAGGKMNGFVEAAMAASSKFNCAKSPYLATCAKFEGPQRQPDLMSYLTRADIPNYWHYADWGVLQDHMFESVDSYSLPSHMYLFSAWAASCTNVHDPMSCASDPRVNVRPSPYPWTDISWLLDKAGVSWAYYVGNGTNICSAWPKCASSDPALATPPNWNPVPGFLDVQQAGQVHSHVLHTSDFLAAAAAGTLPQVSWVIPGASQSEHPRHGLVGPGQAYVTNLINTIGQGPDWSTCAIFLSWDDWGGFYDQMKPPAVDANGYGLRVPGLVISPYAKAGYVDHQILSGDAYLKFIEDVFLGGQRLNPATDGRRDSRPNVREAKPILGDIANDFDFTQTPRPAPVIP